MRLDWEIAKRGWRRYAAYPAAAWAGAFTNSVFGFMQAYVLLALFRHRTDVGGYDVGDAVTYVWLAQALIMTVYVFGWDELALRIRDGSIATDLSRPLNPQRYWLAFDLGRAPFHFIFRGHPAVPDRRVRLRPPLPHAAARGRLRRSASFLAVVVSLGFRFLYNVGRVLDRRPPRRLASLGHRCLFFSGMTLPLAFFPDWLETFARVLPFASIVQVPIDVYLGKHTGLDLVGVLALQAAWAVALLALGRVALDARHAEAGGAGWLRASRSTAAWPARNIRAQLQYRVSFVLDLIATFLISFLDFLAVLILFHNVPRLAGWSVHEVAFLYGISSIAFALAELLVGHIEQLAHAGLRTGTFDVLLARPRGTLYQVVGERASAAPARQGAAGARRLRLRARGR